MADAADLSLDLAKIDKDADRLVRGYLTAGTTAVVNLPPVGSGPRSYRHALAEGQR
jgi:hypothetical protein